MTDNFILQIQEDDFSQLWIGTRHGINRIDASRKKITPIQQKYFEGANAGHNDIKQLQFDFHGNLYFSVAQCLFRINKNELTKHKPKVDTLYQGFFNGFLIDKSNVMHFIKRNEYHQLNLSLNKLAFNRPVFTDSITNFVHELYFDICQNKLIIGNGSGLYCVNESKKIIEPLLFNKLDIKGIRSIKTIKRNECWVATDNGLYIYNANSGKIKKYESPTEYTYAIPTTNLNSVSVTHDSIVWVGTAGYGVSTSDLTPRNFSFINGYSHPEIKSKIFTSVIFNHNYMLVGTDNGIYLLDSKQNFSNYFFAGEKTTCLLNDGDLIWVGTTTGIKLLAFENNTFRVKQIPTQLRQVKNEIFKLKKDYNGIMWIGTYYGLYKYDFKQSELTSYFPNPTKNSISGTYILSIAIDDENTTWFGHANGFSSYKNGKFKNYNYVELGETKLTHRIISSIECIENEIWLGTYGGGITIYNKKTNNYRHITTSDGLSSDMVVSLQYDRRNKVFAGTSNGLNVIEKKNNKVQKYFKENGLISNQFSFNGNSLNKDNNYFAATNQGIVFFNHSTVKNSIQSPVIKSILLNYKMIQNSNKIQLDQSANHILFNLSIPDVRWETRLQLQYRLLPNDVQFKSLPQGQTSLELSNLPYGSYTLQVRTYNPFQKKSSTSISIGINNIIPFTQTTIFRLVLLILMMILIALLVFALLKIRYKRSLRKIEEENRIISERERISRDLHDNIGSQLTYIASTVDYLKKLNQLKDTSGSTNELLNELGQYTRKTVQNLRDTIWAISHDNITLDEFSHRIKTFMVNYLSYHKNIEFTLNLTGNGQAVINPTSLLHVFRIVQESTNNIIKHANADKINIQIECHHTNLSILVNDNGKGFDLNQIGEGYGLSGMRQRAEDMNGKFSIESTIGIGTSIKLNIPF